LSLDLHYAAGSWPSYTVTDDALLSVGTHLIDLVRWLTASEVRRVRARFLTSTRAVIELESGRGTAYVSCATDQARRDAITVNGEDGRVIACHNGVGLSSKVAALWRMARDKRFRRLIHPASRTMLVRLLIQELEAFAAAAHAQRTGITPSSALATASDGFAVMAVVDAARRSAADDGSWQAVASSSLDQLVPVASAAR
jgi:predicted dehydrogenase